PVGLREVARAIPMGAVLGAATGDGGPVRDRLAVLLVGIDAEHHVEVALSELGDDDDVAACQRTSPRGVLVQQLEHPRIGPVGFAARRCDLPSVPATCIFGHGHCCSFDNFVWGWRSGVALRWFAKCLPIESAPVRAAYCSGLTFA